MLNPFDDVPTMPFVPPVNKVLEKRLKRLNILAMILRDKGFYQMADEVASLQKWEEVSQFYNAFKSWLF